MDKVRRNTLKALALAPVIALTGYYVISPGYQDLIIAAIKTRLSYLTLDEEGIKAFARVLMITTMEPFRDRLNGATSGSA